MAEPGGGFVGREDPHRTLQAWLLGEESRGTLSVGSISGPGGIGKTFLLDHVLRSAPAELAARQYLTLRAAGSGGARTLAQVVVNDLADSVQESDVRKGGFSRVRRCRQALDAMDRQARAEVEQQLKEQPELAQTVSRLFALGTGVLEVVPHPSAYAAARLAGKVDPKQIEAAVHTLQQLSAYQMERGLLKRAFPGGETSLRNALRGNLGGVMAASLMEDLEEQLLPGLLSRPPRSRLLLILDDYERLSSIVAGFLTEELVPRLAKAEFQTLLLVLGRDRLVDTHAAWKQTFDRHLLGNVALSELSAEETRSYLSGRGITDPAVVARIIDDTEGYPYLLQSEVEAELEGGSSALGIATFFDRTTRWMTEEQRRWSLRLAFLDEITLETIPAVIDDADPADVLAWFKKEGSLRSRSAATWSMLPIIRSRLRTYVKNDSPGLFRALEQAGGG